MRWHRRIYFGRHFKGAALAGFLVGPGFRLRHRPYMLLRRVGLVISLLRPGFSGPGRAGPDFRHDPTPDGRG